MIITVNGDKYKTVGATTLGELIKELDLIPERVAVEYNLKVIKKADYDTTVMQEGDTLELVNFVGGG